MRRRILGLLRRLGLIPYKPYLCRTCGFSVPLVGSRWEQAGYAVEHWEANHSDPDYLPFDCVHCGERVRRDGRCGCATPEGNKE